MLNLVNLLLTSSTIINFCQSIIDCTNCLSSHWNTAMDLLFWLLPDIIRHIVGQ